MQPPFDLSVILAEARGNPALDPPLAAIECACEGIRAEVLVVRCAGRPALRSSSIVALRELTVDESLLVPERWGVGVRAAQAPVFACLTTELTPAPTWARSLLEALRTGAAGAASALALAPGAGARAAAVYLVRFSAFLPGNDGDFRPRHDMPGDGAAYRRDAVVAFPELLAQGFWEAEFHRRFHAQGSALVYASDPLVSFDSAVSLGDIMSVRARHGRGYGQTMVADGRRSAARLVLGAPAVPAVLLLRIFRRAARAPGMLWQAMRSLPALLMICSAWAWGEGGGAWAARKPR